MHIFHQLYLYATRLQGINMAYDKRKHPILLKTAHHTAFSCYSLLKVKNCWWKSRTDIITNTWMH